MIIPAFYPQTLLPRNMSNLVSNSTSLLRILIFEKRNGIGSNEKMYRKNVFAINSEEMNAAREQQ